VVNSGGIDVNGLTDDDPRGSEDIFEDCDGDGIFVDAGSDGDGDGIFVDAGSDGGGDGIFVEAGSDGGGDDAGFGEILDITGVLVTSLEVKLSF
jgi:hypothetical protein